MKVLFLLLLCSSLIASEGIVYTHVTTDAPQSIHILEVDPEKCTITPARALDMGIGRESVASLAMRHGASAAINGGFFSQAGTFEGIPAGILKIDGNWFGLGKKPRGAIGWKKETCHPFFDRLITSGACEINGYEIEISGINQPPKKNEATLFSSDFGFTTLTNPGGTEVVIHHGRVKSISKLGSSYIPHEGYVLSISPEKWVQIPAKTGSKYLKAAPHIHIFPSAGQENWNDLDHIVGGAPLLIHEGNRITDFTSEQTIETFLTNRHARTAVGLLPNGHWLLVAIDGKQPELSLGMTMDELAAYMESLGCIEALNLDGGGSTTMFYNNRIVNQPTGDEDEDEGLARVRKVSDALLIIE